MIKKIATAGMILLVMAMLICSCGEANVSPTEAPGITNPTDNPQSTASVNPTNAPEVTPNSAATQQPDITPTQQPGNTDTPPTANTNEITLSDTTSTFTGTGVSVSGSVVTINKSGTYSVTGTLTNGQLVVNASGDVNVILNNVNITNKSSAALLIYSDTIVTLKDGTVNKLKDGSTYTYTTDEESKINGTIFSKGDLTIEGKGSLDVTGLYANGISSKDGMTIKDGVITVNANKNAISGKDFVVINGGTLTLNAETSDGIKSNNDEDEDRGYVTITGGTITISTVEEGIDAIRDITIEGGTVIVKNSKNGIKTDSNIMFTGGTISITADKQPCVAVSTLGSSTVDVSFNGKKVSFE